MFWISKTHPLPEPVPPAADRLLRRPRARASSRWSPTTTPAASPPTPSPGRKYGFKLLWIFILLVPMAYYVQEMTVRLGAVTKRGHAEAIFEGFGPFWGWFSLVDLALINWLTLVTEYIGMTAAAEPLRRSAVAHGASSSPRILFAIVLTGQYWTFEKLTLFFCVFNLVYVPAAFWAMETPTAPAAGAPCSRGSSPRTSRWLARAALHRARQHRHDDHALADLLPAERGGGQGARRQGHHVRQDRHPRRVAPDLRRRGLHHHRDRRRLLLPPPADRHRGRAGRRPRPWPRCCPTARGPGRGGCSPSACSTPGSSARCASRCRPSGPSARSSAGRTR